MWASRPVRAMIAASLATMTKQDTLKQNTEGQICPTGDRDERKSNEDAAKTLKEWVSLLPVPWLQ